MEKVDRRRPNIRYGTDGHKKSRNAAFHGAREMYDKHHDQYVESESESDDSVPGETVFPVPYFKGSKGQAVGLWSFLRHDSIAVFTPGRDLNYRITMYAEKHLGYDRHLHKMMVLTPGALRPLGIRQVYSIRPGSVVMVMPNSKNHVTVEIDQLKDRISIEVGIMTTIQSVKSKVRKLKGIPIDRQDLLFKDKALENNRRLLEYRVSNNSVLYVMIQTHFDLLINVDTFWGKTYRFYMDPCSTVKDVLFAVLNRTFSKHGHKDERIHEYHIPLHTLEILFKGKVIAWDFCLSAYKVRSDDHLVLTTTSYLNEIELQHFQVVVETGQRYGITASKYDRWAVVAYLLHGQTNVPIDFMVIYKDGGCMDLHSVIGIIPFGASIIMNIVMKYVDSDLMLGVPLKVNIGNGITEILKISPMKTVASATKKLERLGVPNATLYELTTGVMKISAKTRVQDVLNLKLPLMLKLEKFPVFVHNFNGVIYKTFSHVTQTIGQFKHKMELKSGQSMSRCRMIMCGRDLREHDSTKLHDAGVRIGTSIFIGPEYDAEHFLILDGGKMMKLRLPVNPRLADIRDAVLNETNLPPYCINCILTFLYWYFYPRFSNKYRSKPRTRIQNRLPVSEGTLLPLHPVEQAQHFHSGTIKKFQYDMKTGSNKSWPLTDYHKFDAGWPTFEPSQILD